MKKQISIFILIVISIAIHAQSDSSFLIDDIRFSLNLSSSESGDIGNQLGFGIGVYHTFSPEKKFNTILGVEFNRNNQVISYMHEEGDSYATDVKFHTSAVSLLAVSRYSVGKKTKVFVEAGVFLEYVRSTGRSGTMYSSKDSLGVEFRDSKNQASFSYGVVAGLGMMIPFYENAIIIKPEYKIGSNVPYGFMDMIPNRYFRFVIGLKI